MSTVSSASGSFIFSLLIFNVVKSNSTRFSAVDMFSVAFTNAVIFGVIILPMSFSGAALFRAVIFRQPKKGKEKKTALIASYNFLEIFLSHLTAIQE